MAERLQNVLSHVQSGGNGLAQASAKNPNDVVITMAIRTPLCKARKGALKDVPTEILILELLKKTISDSKFDPKLVDEITVGNCQDSSILNKTRLAAITAGYPVTTTTSVLNRFCSSGLMSVKSVAEGILAGSYNCGIAIGVESMSHGQDSGDGKIDPEVLKMQAAQDALMPMGWTSENVGRDFNISREKLDEYAAMSFQRAEYAQKNGLFKDEIIPVRNATQDDGIRYGTTKESLAKVKPAFPQWGDKTTGGNASQVTDGAAAVVLMRRSMAEKLGVKIIAKYVHCVVSGLEPRIMGIGPTFAIPKLLDALKITKEDVDIFEINEAFATMYVYSVEKLGLDKNKVNVNGGAIAIGHPLGATGARQIATGLNILRQRNKKYLLTSMCIGSGMGAAAFFVKE